MALDRTRIAADVDALSPLLRDVSTRIHAHPELKWEEHRAVGWIAEAVASKGIEVERGPNIGDPPRNGPLPAGLKGVAALKVGDKITVKYAVETCNDELVALTITTSTGATIRLRNDDCTPCW